jgi:hypothetical protein
LRAAEEEFARATEKATSACATDRQPMRAPEVAAMNALHREIQAREHELRCMLAESRHADGIIYAMVPDAADLEMMRAAAKVARLRGQHVDLGDVTDGAILFIPRDRRETLAMMRTPPCVWDPRSLAIIETPPAGALVVAWDGTAVGHGVAALMPVSRGGVS